jgi:hypothetical protein
MLSEGYRLLRVFAFPFIKRQFTLVFTQYSHQDIFSDKNKSALNTSSVLDATVIISDYTFKIVKAHDIRCHL